MINILGKKKKNGDSTVSLQTHKEIITEFLKTITLIVDPQVLYNSIVAKINEIFKLKSIYLFLSDDPSGDFYLRFKYSEDNKPIFVSFSQNGKLIQWLTTNETYIDFDEQNTLSNYFDKNERDNLDKLNTNYCFPLVAMNKLIGFILCDKKQSNVVLNNEEKNLLLTLLGQSALAIKNAQLLEEQKLKISKMLTADRLAVAGQLAAGAAHEIKNPLTSIRSTIQYLKTKIDKKDLMELLTGLIEEVDRIDDIVKGLLSFATPDKGEFLEFDLKDIIKSTLSILESQIKGKDIKINYVWAPENTLFHGDRNQIKQIVMNLMLNAFEAIDGSGTIEVNCNYEKEVKTSDKIKGWYVLRFVDNGPGIGGEDIEKLFEPFYTTKSDGSGLGLFTVYGLAQRHRGDISVERTDKSGTSFVLRLPDKEYVSN